MSDPHASPPSRLTVLSGGVGGARFLQGLLHGLRTGVVPAAPDAEVTVVANTADDWWVHGLKVCPDLDTVMYTLGDGIDPERGWGRREETFHAGEELAAYGVEPTWFGLGDRDLATHLVRTQLLESGYPLSQVTQALCRRWLAPTFGDSLRLLPMTDDRVETHVAVHDEASPSGRRAVHLQEYWVRLRASVPAEQVVVVGLEQATPGPGVVEPGGVDARHHGHAGRGEVGLGGGLVAHQRDHLGRRSHERQTRVTDRRGERRVLGQEPVPGVDRVGAGGGRRRHHPVDHEVAVDRRRGTEPHHLVGFADVRRIEVGVRAHRHRRDPEAPAGGLDATGDLSAVGDQHPLEHVALPGRWTAAGRVPPRRRR
jgi:hypothetical protein